MMRRAFRRCFPDRLGRITAGEQGRQNSEKEEALQIACVAESVGERASHPPISDEAAMSNANQ